MIRATITRTLVFIITLSFVLLLGGRMPYFIFYIFIFTLLIPLIHNLLILSNIKGEVKVPNNTLSSGNKIDIEYRLINGSNFAILYMDIENDILKKLTGKDSPKLSISMEGKDVFSNRENIVLRRRGFYEFGQIIVRLKDVLGLYSFKKTIKSPTSLLVYPQIVNLSTFKVVASQQAGDLIVNDLAYEDRSRTSSIREYQEGDPVKSIHWKLSAKSSNPLIKNYEFRGDTFVNLYLDNKAEGYKRDKDRLIEDKAVEVAAAIINYCLNNNIEINFKTQDEEKIINLQGQYKSDFKPFLEILAKLNANGSFDFQFNMEDLKKASTTVIISPNIDKKMAGHGLDLKMKNLNPVFIYIKDFQSANKLLVERLRQEGISVFVIDIETSIKEALEVHNG